jgi:hypothetical protein
MKWTNIYNLPRPLYVAIAHDLYNLRRDEQLKKYREKHGLREDTPHFSASDLIKAPRMRILTKRHWLEIVKDVSADMFRIFGQMFHYFLREVAIKAELEKEGYRAEERMFAHIQVDGQTVIIHGEPDIVDPQGALDDYKFVAVYAWIKGAKDEWEQQTNVYAWLRSMRGLVTTGLRICFALRDWQVSETVQEGYPPAAGQMESVPMWTFEQQQAWIEGRVRIHLSAEQQLDDELPECTPKETWEKPEAYALIRKGNKVASKVLTPAHCHPKEGQSMADALREEAFAREAEMNSKLKGKEADRPYHVEHRPGERTRCLRFCDVRQFCNQFKEYAGATFRGTGADRQPVEAPGE